MAEAVQGIDTILLFRLITDEKTKSAAKLAFQTEHEITESRDSDSLATKDGAIVTPQALETELTCTSILAKSDELVKELRDAQRDYTKVEIWEIDRSQFDDDSKPVADRKYQATYYQGYVTEYSKSPSAEDALEISLTFAIEGEGQDGFATLTAAQQNVAQYVFRDTTPLP